MFKKGQKNIVLKGWFLVESEVFNMTFNGSYSAQFYKVCFIVK